MMSPVLFSLFINELVDLIENSGLKGIQLFPESIEIFLLLFADDVALISDSVIGLQRQLSLLCVFVKIEKLMSLFQKQKWLSVKMVLCWQEMSTGP